MTKNDWKKIEGWWGCGYSSICLKIDGYKINLYNSRDTKKMILLVEVFVDDVFKGIFLNKDNEVGNRFYQRIKKPLSSSKTLKENAKIFGKRHKLAQQSYFEYNNPYWRSFSAFKKHISGHNTSIELVDETEDKEHSDT